MPTVRAYTDSFNFVAKLGYEQKCYNSIDLHKQTYKHVREKFNLPSQLAISSRMKTAECLTALLAFPKKHKSGKKTLRKKADTKCPQSKQQSIRYDARSYALRLDRNEVSILTLKGRVKIPVVLNETLRAKLEGWRHTSAELVIRKARVFLHIVFEKEIPDFKPETNSKVVGVDRGISKLAATSENKFFGGGEIRKQVRKYQRLRSKLQRKGTKSAKRHLVRLSGRERRFRADTNHRISKQIILSLNTGDTISLEDLTGIREVPRNKRARTLINSWSFYQLEQFLIYKANAKGIRVVFVEAAYTSQTCSRCGFRDKKNRKTQSSFCCTACSFKLNADLNASRNIRDKHLAGYKPADKAVVNQPNRPFLTEQPIAAAS